MSTQPILLKGASIYLEDDMLSDGALLLADGKIQTIFESSVKAQANARTIELPKGSKIVPGRVDLHIHGAVGHDVMDATPEAMRGIAQQLPAEGTTAFLATTMTMATQDIERAITNVATHMADKSQQGAEVLGLHLEGPFISKERLGAHDAQFVLEPDVALMRHWQQLANNQIKLVTLAPEAKDALVFIEYLESHNIIPSIGHTDATMPQTLAAIDKGCCHATHLFNAMSGVHHRHPGAAAAILQSQQVLAELITDGYHVTPEMIKFSLMMKGSDHVCLVTDAIRAKCLGEGKYDLGGHQVMVKDNQARMADGTLAGSVLTMQEAVMNFMRFTDCTLETVIKLTSVNPAKQLGCFSHKGSIAAGKDADILVLNENNEVHSTYCLGELAYNCDL